jgi:hypothetical protein
MEHQWNEIDRGKPTTRRKTCPNATMSTTNPTWTDPGLCGAWETYTEGDKGIEVHRSTAEGPGRRKGMAKVWTRDREAIWEKAGGTSFEKQDKRRIYFPCHQ